MSYQIYQIDTEAMKGMACLCDNDLVSLKRLNIHTPIYYGSYVAKESSRKLYQQFIMKIMKQIEYVGVDQYCCQDMVGFMLEGMASMREKRDRLKIRINGTEGPAGKGTLFEEDTKMLKTLIVMLDVKYENWMIIGHTLQVDAAVVSELYDDAISKGYIVKHYTTGEGKYYRCNFVISNSGCSINGYLEKWIMCCDCCKQMPVDTTDETEN